MRRLFTTEKICLTVLYFPKDGPQPILSLEKGGKKEKKVNKKKLSPLPFLLRTQNWKVSFPFINSFYQIKVNSLFMENKEDPFWYSAEVAIRFRSLLIFLKSGKAACCWDYSQTTHAKQANKFYAKQILAEKELGGEILLIWETLERLRLSLQRGFGRPIILDTQRKNCREKGACIILRLFSVIM